MEKKIIKRPLWEELDYEVLIFNSKYYIPLAKNITFCCMIINEFYNDNVLS